MDDEWNMEIPKIRSGYLSKKAYEKGFSKDTCKSKYTMHPENDKIYHDVKEVYWWIGTKRDIVSYDPKFLICSQVKVKHQKSQDCCNN